MTCIVGLIHEGRIYIGADSASVARDHMSVREDRKVFSLNNGAIMIGFTTSFRMGQILQYHLKLDLPEPGADLFKWMVTVFAEAVRDILGKHGWKKKEHDREEGGMFLVSLHGSLFYFDEEFHVGIPKQPFYAVGSGYLPALGSLMTSHGSTLDPKRRIAIALECAATYITTVRGPMIVMDGSPDPNYVKPAGDQSDA